MNLDAPVEKKRGFKDFLKSNLKLLVGLCAVLVFTGAIFLWLDYNKKNKRVKISENYVEAKILLTENNPSESLEILKNIVIKNKFPKKINTY